MSIRRVPAVPHRTSSGIIKWIQYLFRGREFKSNARHADEIAARSQPPPCLPEGPYHRTSKMYYFARDARREVQPPTIIPLAGELPGTEGLKETKSLTPGKIYIPDK